MSGQRFHVDLSALRETFLEEAAEHLAAMEDAILGLERAPDDPELVSAVFRAAHSLKGGSDMLGLRELARLTHALESVLDRVRGGRLSSRSLPGVLLRALDALRTMHAAARRGETRPAPDAVLVALEALVDAGVAPGPAAPREAPPQGRSRFRVAFRPAEDLLLRGMDPLVVLRELDALGEVTAAALDASGLPALSDLDPERCHLAWTLELETERTEEEVREVFAFVTDSSQVVVEDLDRAAPPAPAASAGVEAAEEADVRRPARAEASSLRVATEKVDKILNLVGELVIANSMVVEAARDRSGAGAARLLAAVADLERNTRELQDRVMAIRMVPMSTIFGRFHRLVRDLGVSLEKEVVLVTAGEETELDKGVSEGICDPLVHLIRNAVDHGIEPPEERVGAGKPRRGTVRVSAYHQGGSVVVEVEDDGRGLDVEKIRRRAHERGLLPQGEPASEEQLLQLIFLPGFSTAEAVTALSGRGVGMDVVKRNVEAQSGAIAVESRPGEGARFRIKLPLTLSILEGQLVQVRGEVLVVPLTAVVQSFRPAPGQVESVLGRGEVVRFRGETVPIARLAALFGARDAGPPSDEGLLCVVEDGGARLALAVDEVVGQAQVVLKSIESNFRRVEGVMGATVLGDGRVALILDVPGVARLSGRRREVAGRAGRLERREGAA